MPDFLTDCIDATALLGAAYFVVALIVSFDRWERNGGTFHPTLASESTLEPIPVPETLTDEALQAIAERYPLQMAAATLVRPEAVRTLDPLSESAAPDYGAMTVPQLRQECSAHQPKIHWRNARPDGKNRWKGEMIAALQAQSAVQPLPRGIYTHSYGETHNEYPGDLEDRPQRLRRACAAAQRLSRARVSDASDRDSI